MRTADSPHPTVHHYEGPATMTSQIAVTIVATWLLLQQPLNGVYGFSARGPSSTFMSRAGGRHSSSSCNSRGAPTTTQGGDLLVCWAAPPPQEELAAALTEYLAKAHDEKLRAVQEVQAQKDEQIAVLKKTIAELQQQTPSSSSSSIVLNGSSSSSAPVELEQKVVELESKLRAYQDFVAKYIVDAQYQKMLAVKAAEEETAKKLGAQLQLGGSTATPPPSAPTTTTTTTSLEQTKENVLYLERNARVAEAAKAGKSRWGALEVQRAASQQVTTAAASTAVNGAPTTAIPITVPPEVIEADHGLRAEGSVGGWSLAERVALGAKAGSASFVVNGSVAVPAAAPLGSTVAPTLYQLRNAKVAAAGKAGKSRWGAQELTRVSELAALAPTIVGGGATPNAAAVVSSARVNIGAKILGQN